jgi:hypothetical protein
MHINQIDRHLFLLALLADVLVGSSLELAGSLGDDG